MIEDHVLTHSFLSARFATEKQQQFRFNIENLTKSSLILFYVFEIEIPRVRIHPFTLPSPSDMNSIFKF